MAFVVKTIRTLRNHWKKSTFAAIILTYGYSYTKERFETQKLMRAFCEKAAEYGEVTIPVTSEPRNITVILNPNANKRKATDDFEKYCAPILHLAGIVVNVIKTESEGHARTLISNLDNTDAIVVAGGDGTLSEVVTGLLRRTEENTNGLIPLGVLPVGKTNTVANMLFQPGQHLARVTSLAEATMAVVEEVVQPINVLRVEALEGDNKPIYALSGIKWGAFRDAEIKKDNYWVYGSLRKYATYLFNGYKTSLTWHCNALLNYSPPCKGCSNCAPNKISQKSWVQRLFQESQPSFAHIKNADCENIEEKTISTVDFILSVSNPSDNETVPKLSIKIGENNIGYLDFVKEGWRSENGHERSVREKIDARSVVIEPKDVEKNENGNWLSIDNENFELKTIKVTVLPKIINMFCKKSNF